MAAAGPTSCCMVRLHFTCIGAAAMRYPGRCAVRAPRATLTLRCERGPMQNNLCLWLAALLTAGLCFTHFRTRDVQNDDPHLHDRNLLMEHVHVHWCMHGHRLSMARTSVVPTITTTRADHLRHKALMRPPVSMHDSTQAMTVGLLWPQFHH